MSRTRYAPMLMCFHESKHLVCINCGNFSPPIQQFATFMEMGQILAPFGWSTGLGEARCKMCQDAS